MNKQRKTNYLTNIVVLGRTIIVYIIYIVQDISNLIYLCDMYALGTLVIKMLILF